MPSRDSIILLAALAISVAGCGRSPTLPDSQDLAVFAYDPSAPLQYEQVPITSPRPEIPLYRVWFQGPGGGQVSGMLAVPQHIGRGPAILLMHGAPSTAEAIMLGFGLDHAARGAVVLAIDAPWARRGAAPWIFTAQDSVDQVQLMKELQRAVDVLTARRDVDPARIAYVGGSYGGAMGVLFAAIETRIKAFVLFVPDGGLVAHHTEANGAPRGSFAAVPQAQRERWLSAMQPIEPIRFIGSAPARDLLIQSGRDDELVSVDDAEALHAAARQPKTVIWYQSGHALPSQAIADRLAWLAARIGTLP